MATRTRRLAFPLALQRSGPNLHMQQLQDALHYPQALTKLEFLLRQ